MCSLAPPSGSIAEREQRDSGSFECLQCARVAWLKEITRHARSSINLSTLVDAKGVRLGKAAEP
jgi:hypothetical protein